MRTVRSSLLALGLFPVSFAAGAAPAHMDDLATLRLQTRSYEASSYHRVAGHTFHENNDGIGYLYREGDEFVVMEAVGPGVLHSFWMTEHGLVHDPDESDLRMKVFFDGAGFPQIDIRLADLFSGTYEGYNGAFATPLVSGADVNSGGLICYVPLPFAESVKITLNRQFYYNFFYDLYPPGTPIDTWTGTEDNSALLRAWENAGLDPKSSEGNETISETFDLEAGATRSWRLEGPRSISSIRLRIDGVEAARPQPQFTSAGRRFFGSSEFEMPIAPDNQGVMLKRRMDHAPPGAFWSADNHPRANVHVYRDGEWHKAAEYYTPHRYGGAHWRNTVAFIPKKFTAGEDSLRIRIENTSHNPFNPESRYRWNEHAYRAYNVYFDRMTPAADSPLEIGDEESERAHNYTADPEAIHDTVTSSYPTYITNCLYDDYHVVSAGATRFRINLDPANDGVVLKRRLDRGYPDQKAAVHAGPSFEDLSKIGAWSDSGSDPIFRWRESTFEIPAELTRDRAELFIEIRNKDLQTAWTAAWYGMFSSVNGEYILTDEIDVGNADSESAANRHFEVAGEYERKEETLHFPPGNFDAAIPEIINNTWIRITWDDADEPAIDAPISSFFGSGKFGPFGVRAIAFGMDDTETFYNYLPMPFEGSATVELVSRRTDTTRGIELEIAHKPFTGSFANVGNLKTDYIEHPLKVNSGSDIVFLEVEGSGQLVGTVHSMKGLDGFRSFLEGDERFYIDGSQSPAWHGTGKEDFFQGAWYFIHDVFTRPMAGASVLFPDSIWDRVAAYRMFTANPIPFRKGIRAGIEHGMWNNFGEKATTLTFYYHDPRPRLEKTDILDIGDPASESSHAYTVSDETWSGALEDATYEGDDDDIPITDTGRAHRGFSEFEMAVSPDNDGVILRRRLDQADPRQGANVYLIANDGSKAFVARWYEPNENTTHRWRDSDLWIPASMTNGKDRIRVRIETDPDGPAWSEFRYTAYSMAPCRDS